MCPLGFHAQMDTDWASSRLSPSQPSCLPSSPLSFPVSLLLYLPPFSLPALCFSSPSSCVFTIQVNEGSQNWLGLLVGILFSWSIREKQAALWRSLNPLSPLSRLCSYLRPTVSVCLSLSLFLSVSLYICHCLLSCVWVPSAVGGEIPRPFEELLEGKQREKDLVPPPALGHDWENCSLQQELVSIWPGRWFWNSKDSGPSQ